MKSDIITVTPTARSYINERLDGDGLLLTTINNKGCSGNSIEYRVIYPYDVGKFDEMILWEGGGIVIHSSSVMGLLGSTLDVKTTMIENYLVWENPQAVNKCGCGTSFELKPCEQVQ